MLHETQRTSAPSAFSVSISTAVWIVMCREPAMRAPLSGWRAAYCSRTAMRPGISVSAIAISLRPQAASFRLATRKSLFSFTAALIRSLLLREGMGAVVVSTVASSLAAAMAVRGRRLVDRAGEIEHLPQAVRRQVEVAADELRQLLAAELAGAEGL